MWANDSIKFLLLTFAHTVFCLVGKWHGGQSHNTYNEYLFIKLNQLNACGGQIDLLAGVKRTALYVGSSQDRSGVGPNTKLSITHLFFELQSPDFAWKFV